MCVYKSRETTTIFGDLFDVWSPCSFFSQILFLCFFHNLMLVKRRQVSLGTFEWHKNCYRKSHAIPSSLVRWALFFKGQFVRFFLMEEKRAISCLATSLLRPPNMIVVVNNATAYTWVAIITRSFLRETLSLRTLLCVSCGWRLMDDQKHSTNNWLCSKLFIISTKISEAKRNRLVLFLPSVCLWKGVEYFSY